MANAIPVLFDLDGVIVDNIAFENAVTRTIIRQLAAVRNIHESEAESLWKSTLESHRGHARWHDYSFHCDALDLGTAWKKSHTSCGHLLRKCPYADQAITVANDIGPLFLVLIVELLNSAIEAVVDRIGPERNELSGIAKDLGSLAVFVSLVNGGVVWALVLLD